MSRCLIPPFEESQPTKYTEIKPSSSKIAQYQPHRYIYIYDNDYFAYLANLEGWPGNGTPSAPFIIEGLRITTPSHRCAIEIVDVDVYFQIRHCMILGGYHQLGGGIELSRVQNGRIFNNIINYTRRTGISLYLSRETTLENNTISNNGNMGIEVASCSNIFLSGNKINNNSATGIRLYHSGYCTLLHNTVTNIHGRGIHLSDSANSTVFNNTVTNT
ncbi:MAG: right-handed parallel beta-helix repeat-containing protein, partial [Candidatus Hodarchaeota archaeon]